eukprot:RCo043891
MKGHQIGGTTYFYDPSTQPPSSQAQPREAPSGFAAPSELYPYGPPAAPDTQALPPSPLPPYAQHLAAAAQYGPGLGALAAVGYGAGDGSAGAMGYAPHAHLGGSSSTSSGYAHHPYQASGVPLAEAVLPVPLPPRGGYESPYSGLPAPEAPTTPYRRVSQLFMVEALRHNLLRKQTLLCPSVETPHFGRAKAAALQMGSKYHTLRLLDDASRSQMQARSRLQSQFSEVQSEVYKCTNASSGSVVILRRILSPALVGDLEMHMPTIAAWKQFQHPGIVSLRDVTVSSEWGARGGSRDLVFEYEFIAGAVTWETAFLP